MIISRATTLFFDASVLVAGSASSTGGSALLLEACLVRGFRPQVTGAVLMESWLALQGFTNEARARFRRWLTEIVWELVPVPPAAVLAQYERYIDREDAHVLAAAVEAGSQFLLSLDRRHVLAAAPAATGMGSGLVVLTPGDFIRQYYPLHPDYDRLPAERDRP